MITRGDVQRVMDASILEETLYWWLHPIERVQTVRGIDAWDGYHWTLARQMAQDEDWASLKAYMDTLSETYLRDSMEYSFSPRPLKCATSIARHARPKKTKKKTLHPTTPISSKRAWDHDGVGQSGQNRL